MESITLSTKTPANYCIIGLHGLGSDGLELSEFASVLPTTQSIRWVFPHAPIQAVSLRQHKKMRAWYNVYGLSVDSQEDIAGIPAASAMIHHLIEKEIQKGMQSNKIILAGFSQGAALALYSGLRYPERLGGIVALSGYLLLAKQLQIEGHPNNKKTPIFMAHGDSDSVVPVALNQASLNYLKNLGYPVEFYQYSMAHSICLQEIMDINLWLDKLNCSGQVKVDNF